MLENIDGLDFDCITFQEYKSLIDETIKLNKCKDEMKKLIKNKNINKNNIDYTENQIDVMFGYWYNFCDKKNI